MNQLKQKFIATLTANPLLLEIDKFESNPQVFLGKKSKGINLVILNCSTRSETAFVILCPIILVICKKINW